MSPTLTVTTAELGTGGVPTGTGTAFVAGATDMGPPPSGPAYVLCQSITDFVNAFGPRSASSSALYDWLDDFFHESGRVAYVSRATDATAETASLTLEDGAGHPTVVVSALTPGTEGNLVQVEVVAENGETFTATLASGSTSITGVSSFAGIAAGTPVSGTGIPAGTTIQSINQGAGTAVLSQAATASGEETLTPGQVTVTVYAYDDLGNLLAEETRGPYYSTAQLLADTSAWVTFAQATGGGATENLPAAIAATSLFGGADPSDLTDASHVAALANFPASLGVGTVALPGRTTLTAWEGIRDHVNSTNRWGILDMVDASESEEVISQVSQIGSGDWSRCFLIQGSAVIPGAIPNTHRIVPGSASVAALAAQVAQGQNQAQAAAGVNWPLTYALGFTEYYGPVPSVSASVPVGNFDEDAVAAMEAAGVNCFANFYGVLCLFGFVTPISSTQDAIYDQATASRERMALIDDCERAMAPYLFDPIDTGTIADMTNDLNAVCLNHYNGGALYDGGSGAATAAFQVNTGPPINTPATAQAKQLNAQILVRITRYADNAQAQITMVPVTVALPQPAQTS